MNYTDEINQFPKRRKKGGNPKTYTFVQKWKCWKRGYSLIRGKNLLPECYDIRARQWLLIFPCSAICACVMTCTWFPQAERELSCTSLEQIMFTASTLQRKMILPHHSVITMVSILNSTPVLDVFPTKSGCWALMHITLVEAIPVEIHMPSSLQDTVFILYTRIMHSKLDQFDGWLHLKTTPLCNRFKLCHPRVRRFQLE